MDTFWTILNNKNGNYFIQDTISTYKINKHSTEGRGIYLLSKINKKISNDQFKYLRKYFNIPKKNLQILQKNRLTIGTTNDFTKSKNHQNEWMNAIL